MAPLIDVLFLLVLFLIVNSTVVLQPGVRVNLPVSSFEGGASYGAMFVTISQEGMVFFNDERTPLSGLASAFSQSIHMENESRLVIEADARVPHGRIIEIYNMAAEAGIKEVTLATRLPESGSEGSP